MERVPIRQRPRHEKGALKRHFEKCFQELKGILPAGVTVISKMPNIGFVLVQGPKPACLELKKKLEQAGTATMSRNQRIHLIR